MGIMVLIDLLTIMGIMVLIDLLTIMGIMVLIDIIDRRVCSPYHGTLTSRYITVISLRDA
jgi:hypothetical protein